MYSRIYFGERDSWEEPPAVRERPASQPVKIRLQIPGWVRIISLRVYVIFT